MLQIDSAGFQNLILAFGAILIALIAVTLHYIVGGDLDFTFKAETKSKDTEIGVKIETPGLIEKFIQYRERIDSQPKEVLKLKK